MKTFQFTYTPENLAVADKPTWISTTDGDTPTIQMPIRMLGMDAPEFHYEGATEKNPGKFDDAIKSFLSKEGKSLFPGLKEYLKVRLTENPCTRQITAGRKAFDHFEEIAKERLDRGVGKNGKPVAQRKLFIMVSHDVFDKYGRLLAYVNAAYEKSELETIPLAKRPTFNLQMIQDGYAVSLLIYPNIPKPADLKLVQTAVKNCRTKKDGLWSDEERTLLPYEFRWIVDTIQGKREGPDRFCADISTNKLYMPQHYFEVLPENRLFFYEEDVCEAIKMGFKLTY